MLWFKNPDGLLPGVLLLSYLFLVYPLAIYGLSSPAWFLLSLLFMVNVLVLSAYLLHDCLHNNIFSSPIGNERLGKLLAWLVGAVYSPYALLREKHLRHHVERADVLAVDYQQILLNYPLLDRCVRWATFCYFPAVELLMHWLDFLSPFFIMQRSHLRMRNVCIFLIRMTLFYMLLIFSPLAAFGYLLSYLLFLMILGFMDTFQHSYDIHYRLSGSQQMPARDRFYEENNTYSNILSTRFPVINLLVLNFCYHNVHHQKPNVPWYRLPALHRKAYPQSCQQLVSLPQQLANFHRYRIARIHHLGDDRHIGADGVSFLVGV